MAIEGVVGSSTAVQTKKGGIKATSRTSKEGKGSEDKGVASDKEHSESEERMNVAKRKMNKEVDATNQLLLQLPQAVGELQENIKKMSMGKTEWGLIVTLSERAGLEEKRPSRRKTASSKKKKKRTYESWEDGSDS